MDVNPAIDHLKTLGLNFKQYGAAEDLANIEQRLKSLPAIFIIPLAMQGAPNSLVGAIDQKITQRFSVLALLKKPNAGELYKINEAIMTGFVGWSHPALHGGAAGSPAEFANQRTFNFNGNLATSLDFTTSFHFRK